MKWLEKKLGLREASEKKGHHHSEQGLLGLSSRVPGLSLGVLRIHLAGLNLDAMGLNPCVLVVDLGMLRANLGAAGN